MISLVVLEKQSWQMCMSVSLFEITEFPEELKESEFKNKKMKIRKNRTKKT